MASLNKTVFRIAHPPPRSKHQQRLHIPPKRVLQLQSISESFHATPYLDVLTATHNSVHAHQNFVCQLRCNHKIGSNDLVMMKSGAYDTEDDMKKGGELSANGQDQEIIAVLHRPRKGSGMTDVSIRMRDGTLWRCDRLRSGSYEFVVGDESGKRQVARWAPKQGSFSNDLSALGQASEKAAQGETFTFSLLDPNQRRHAVMAHLTSQSIDVCSQYRNPRSSSITQSHNGGARDGKSRSPTTAEEFRPLVTMGEDLKLLILASGVWVGLNEGFSPNFGSLSKSKTSTKTAFDRRSSGNSQVNSSNVSNKSRQDTSHRPTPLTTQSFTSSPIESRQSPQMKIDNFPKRSTSTRSSPGPRCQHRRFSSFNMTQSKTSSNMTEKAVGLLDHRTVKAIESLVVGDDPAAHKTTREFSKGITGTAQKMSTPDHQFKKERRVSSLFKGWHRT